MILRVEPIEVEVIKADRKARIRNAFSFFFFQEKERGYPMWNWEVTVSITTLQVSEVEFTKEMTDDPDGIQIPCYFQKIFKRKIERKGNQEVGVYSYLN